MTKELTIKTSNAGWLKLVADAYKNKRQILIIDDANIGLDPSTQSILEMGKQASLSKTEWAGVLVSLGISGAGLWMLIAAIYDPEPTSKLGLLVSGGTLLILSGGFSAVRVLTNRKPPTVEVTKLGFRVLWD